MILQQYSNDEYKRYRTNFELTNGLIFLPLSKKKNSSQWENMLHTWYLLTLANILLRHTQKTGPELHILPLEWTCEVLVVSILKKYDLCNMWTLLYDVNIGFKILPSWWLRVMLSGFRCCHQGPFWWAGMMDGLNADRFPFHSDMAHGHITRTNSVKKATNTHTHTHWPSSGLVLYLWPRNVLANEMRCNISHSPKPCSAIFFFRKPCFLFSIYVWAR